MCDTVFDPERKIVYDSEHFYGNVTPIYPWAVMLTTRRHDVEGPWDLTEDEAADMGRLIRRLTTAMHKSGCERTYLLFFGEELALPHFHLGLLDRHLACSKGGHDAMWERVEAAKSANEDLEQIANDFAAAVRSQLDLSPAEQHRQHEMATIARYEATGGALATEGWLAGLPLVVLTTRGRSSGKPRKVALVRCEHEGVYAVVGSGPDPIGGTPIHSNWYLNLVNDPKVTLRDRDEVFEAVARTATPEEKALWWPRATAIWPDYDKYQANTTKDIPVVLIERTSPGAS
jgi:deazaflavin-dependent oxidoreductase (nitroreductase family)